MQHEITEKTLLLTEEGQLAAKGYARKMTIEYNRAQVKKNPFNLKEWNFYQIQKDQYVLQLTLGHVSYMCSVSGILIDLKSGKKWEIGSMKPFYVPRLDTDPEGDSLNQYRCKDFELAFRVTEEKRILTLQGKNGQHRNVDIYVELENDRENEKMVIATPFYKPGQFYLNYKENYYQGRGHVQFDTLKVDLGGCTGLVDWGRGIWPYRHEWFWGSLTAQLDGEPFGFNIGWGFGDLSLATENVYFYQKKAYKLGQLHVERDEQDYMKPWYIADPEGKFVVTMTPIFDNYTENKFLVVDTHCNQVYGSFEGSVLTEDGRKEFRGLVGFIEHAVNRW